MISAAIIHQLRGQCLRPFEQNRKEWNVVAHVVLFYDLCTFLWRCTMSFDRSKAAGEAKRFSGFVVVKK